MTGKLTGYLQKRNLIEESKGRLKNLGHKPKVAWWQGILASHATQTF